MAESLDWPMEDGELDDTPLRTEASVVCPHCGEGVIVAIDPSGGTTQQYVEDCEVCCRPWLVSVSYDQMGRVAVSVDPAD